MNKLDKLLEELNRQESLEKQNQDRELLINPLLRYSTTQLKAELRRRKKERN